MVAMLEPPPRLATPTTNALVPALLYSGVPESLPSAATHSHAGPLSLAKVRMSPRPSSASLALVARVAEYSSSILAQGSANRLRMNAGGGSGITEIMRLAEADKPLVSV